MLQKQLLSDELYSVQEINQKTLSHVNVSFIDNQLISKLLK